MILASHGLWKYLTHKEIVRMSKTSYNPSVFARKLADLAIGCGCPLDVSVLVVKLNLDKKPVPFKSTLEVVSGDNNRHSAASDQLVFEGEEVYESDDIEEEEDDDVETTNIDDIMEEAFLEDSLVAKGDETALELEALRAISPDQLDALVFNSPNMVEVQTIIEESVSEESLILQGSSAELYEDTNGEEIGETNEVEYISTLPIPEGQPVTSPTEDTQAYTYTIDDDKPIDVLQDIPELPPLDEDYETSKTFPRNKVTPKKIDFNIESTSFDQTQSVPVVNSETQELSSVQKEMKRRFSASNPALEMMNQAMSQIDDDPEGSGTLERNKLLARKRSFVQTSYSRLSRHLVSASSIHSIQ